MLVRIIGSRVILDFRFSLVCMSIFKYVHFCSFVWIVKFWLRVVFLVKILSISETCWIFKEILIWMLELVDFCDFLSICSRWDLWVVWFHKWWRLSRLVTHSGRLAVLELNMWSPFWALHHILFYFDLFWIIFRPIKRYFTCFHLGSSPLPIMLSLLNWRVWLFQIKGHHWRLLQLNLYVSLVLHDLVRWRVTISCLTPKMVLLFH